jgi:ribonuclease HI
VRIDLTKTNGSSPPIRAWFDGACGPNPGGRAVWGVVIEVNGQTVVRKFGYVNVGPKMSSNVAEFCGCIAALEEINKRRGNALVYGDSSLVIGQLSGLMGVKKGGHYVRYLQKAKAVLQALGLERVKFEWIKSRQNEEAHKLSRQALFRYDLNPGDQHYVHGAALLNEACPVKSNPRKTDEGLDQTPDQSASTGGGDAGRPPTPSNRREEAYGEEI